MELDEYLSIENLHYYLAQEDEGRTVVFTCPACGGTVKIEAAEFVRKLFSGGLDIDCHHASSHRAGAQPLRTGRLSVWMVHTQNFPE